MNKLQLIDADTLYYKPLAHPQMLIDGVLSDGLAILAGDSKIGKSWMVLWLCLQISRGAAALGERPAGACRHPLQYRHLSQPLCCESGEYVDGQKAGGKIRGLLQAAGYVRPYLQGAWPVGGEKSPTA